MENENVRKWQVEAWDLLDVIQTRQRNFTASVVQSSEYDRLDTVAASSECDLMSYTDTILTRLILELCRECKCAECMTPADLKHTCGKTSRLQEGKQKILSTVL